MFHSLFSVEHISIICIWLVILKLTESWCHNDLDIPSNEYTRNQKESKGAATNKILFYFCLLIKSYFYLLEYLNLFCHFFNYLNHFQPWIPKGALLCICIPILFYFFNLSKCKYNFFMFWNLLILCWYRTIPHRNSPDLFTAKRSSTSPPL